MIKAILIDFNGVIIDDEPLQMKAYQEVFSDQGVGLSEEQYYGCLGMNDESFVRTILGDTDTPDERVFEIVDAKTAGWKKAVEERIPLFDGMEDVLRRLTHSFALGVVSMARRREIDHVLDRTGLDDCFDVILSAEDISTTKPDPECYREGFLRIDAARVASGGYPLTRRQCVVIEDTPQGIEAGKAAGLRTVGVANTVDAGQLRRAGADVVTGDLRDWNAASFNGVFG